MFVFRNFVPVVKQCLYFSCRWRKSQFRPPTQKMTALCWDTFMTVSSLWHENPLACTLAVKKTANTRVLHRLCHHGEKINTAWRDWKFIDKKRTKRRLDWQNEKDNGHRKKISGHAYLHIFYDVCHGEILPTLQALFFFFCGKRWAPVSGSKCRM